MKIETRTFGSVEIDEAQVVTLVEPMPGFPGCIRFAVLDPEPGSPFQWFQSVEQAGVCFLIADPVQFFPGYQVALRPPEARALQLDDSAHALVAVVLTVPEDPNQATANLLAPIVFNVEKKLARQVILEGSEHPVRASIFEEMKQASNGG